MPVIGRFSNTHTVTTSMHKQDRNTCTTMTGQDTQQITNHICSHFHEDKNIHAHKWITSMKEGMRRMTSFWYFHEHNTVDEPKGPIQYETTR